MIEISSADDVLRITGDQSTKEKATAADADLTITVRYLRAQTSGESVCVGVELTDSLRNLTETRRYSLHTRLLADLGLRRGIISREKLLQLESAAQLSAAWQRALNILAYGANSAQALMLKLRQRGFDDQTARAAVELVREQGYLKEEHDATREAQRCVSKGWGKRRIEQYLRQRGYPSETARQAMQALCEVDFESLCCRITRKYCAQPPADAKARQKVVAYLLRYGYDMTDIRHALEHAWE